MNLNESIDYKSIPAATKKKLSWSGKSKTLVITAPLTEEDTANIKSKAVMEGTHEAIEQAAETSRSEKAIDIFHSPSERGERFFVPQMEVFVNGELRLFDEPEAIDYPWDLPVAEAKLTRNQKNALDIGDKISEGGLIDVDEEKGRLQTRFIQDLSRDLGLSYQPEHWNETKLAAWLCHQLKDPFITHTSSRNFVVAWLTDLLNQKTMDLSRINRQKFQLRTLLEEQIKTLRKDAAKTACSQFLFDSADENRVRIGTEYEFEFHPDAYSPSRYDEGQYGDYGFEHHYYPRIGALDNLEEFYCACWLDECNEIDFWVRNPVRKNGGSFFLQTPEGRFFPDFVCKLKDGRILVVENKGGHLWSQSNQDRMVGDLWESQSEGKCLFVMVKEKKWEWIQAKISGA